ncbi:hypothetical protein PF002_g5400 [Phytophthora fragariae]|uniref:FYVE-type domain-containing protein n=1 Tax=Phytophthora fragariae TaxID=53985 RepID=A0A6A4A4U6_9STRA|nr:hypothetical protein PF002_g5400 [Phytophthora fragariae]
MASRFPMNVPPFPPLAMADSERDRLEYLAHRLVHKAIDDYDVHRQAGGNVDARSWKLVRKCDHLAMYKRTEPSGLYQVAHARQPATPIRSRAESASVVGNSITQGRPRQKMPTPESPGGVDVFMKARFDPNGNVSESVATQSIALTLMYSAKASVCAQNKKLSWLIRSSSDSSARKRPTRSMSMARQRSCPICAKNFNMFSGTAECEICSTVTCHACSVKKKLGFAKTGSKRVILHPVTFCTSCLTHARRLDDFDAARQEVMAGFGVDETSSATSRSRGESIPSVHNCRRRDIQKTKTAPSITKDEPPEVTRHHSEGVMEENNTPPRARQRVNTWIGDVGASQATHRWDELERQVAASGLVEPSEELEEFGEITIHESSLVKVADGRDQRSVSFAEPYPGSPKCETTQEDFMARIITMRKAAEDAYLTTRKTAQAQFEQITEVPSVSATTRTPTRSGNAS